jgi:hypothetical protein
MNLLLLVGAFLPMVVEARVSARHERALRAMGASEPADDVYGAMRFAIGLGALMAGRVRIEERELR